MTIVFTKRSLAPNAWRIVKHDIKGHVFFEVTDHLGRHVRKKRVSLYFDLLIDMLELDEAAIISQYIDRAQWSERIRNPEEYAATIARQFQVDTASSVAYESADLRGPAEDTFCLHVAGAVSRPLLQRVLNFGMTCLPNIIYAVPAVPEFWLPQLFSWNGRFIRWFHLQDSDRSLVSLLEEVSLLIWTADGHLRFGSSAVGGADAIQQSIEMVATRNGVELDIQADNP